MFGMFPHIKLFWRFYDLREKDFWVTMSMLYVIQGDTESIPGLPYMWNYSRDHSGDIS
jgi:hypothetical protein